MFKKFKFSIVLSFILVFQMVLSTNVYAKEMCTVRTNSNYEDQLKAKENIPMLKSLKQISKNKIEVTYDREVDLASGVKATNYWIQSVTESNISGIATLGKDDKVNSDNSLTDDKVEIKAKNPSNKTFILTFKEDITSNAKYKLIICYVIVPGGAPYSGDNGAMEFIGK